MTIRKYILESWGKAVTLTVRTEDKQGELVIKPGGYIELFGSEYHCDSADLAVKLVEGMGLVWWKWGSRWERWD